MIKTLTSPDDFINEWSGTPHVFDGRSREGTDCWGLVRLYYQIVLGKELPDWQRADHSKAWVMRTLSTATGEHMEWLEKPRDHCIVVGRRSEGAWHMGIWYLNGVFHVGEKSRAHWSQRYAAEIEFGGSLRFGVPRG